MDRRRKDRDQGGPSLGHPDPPQRQGLVRFLNQRTAAEMWFGAIASILTLGMVDILTGPELALSLFYLLPIVAIAWTGGLAAAWTASFVSGAMWLTADVIARHQPLAAWLHLWNAATRLSLFLICSTLIVQLRRSDEHQRQAARTDPLTGVSNSRWFDESLGEMLRAAREKRVPVSFAYIDIDSFKTINDTFGHSSGDRVLRFVAQALRNNLRSEDILARLGGDEFGVALLGETDQAWRPLERARQEIKTGLDWVHPTVSIGLATFLVAPEAVDELIRAADEIMYEVKADGRDQLKHRLVTQDETFPSARAIGEKSAAS
ncbi:MAG: diguanylate cyclase [Actinomycetota bacterium]